jgi:hypothetical protein
MLLSLSLEGFSRAKRKYHTSLWEGMRDRAKKHQIEKKLEKRCSDSPFSAPDKQKHTEGNVVKDSGRGVGVQSDDPSIRSQQQNVKQDITMYGRRYGSCHATCIEAHREYQNMG